MKHSKKLLRTACCALIVAVMAVVSPASALASFSAVVTSSSMRVYAARSVNSASATLPKGTVVTVKSYSDGVAKISYKGKTGYARVSDMKAVESSGDSSSSSAGTSTTVSASGARAYKTASTSAQSVSVAKGTKVSVVSTSGSWAKVQRNGHTAWMQKSALALYASSSGGSSSGSRAEQVIAAAKAKQGCAYVYGRSGPSTFDCAGLVKYAFRQVDVSLSGSAKGQGYNSGTKVSYSQLRAGDIVCFDTVEDNDLSDHTGIYLGGGKFIHCSSAAGKVIISSLSSGYYRRVFSWGRRVL